MRHFLVALSALSILSLGHCMVLSNGLDSASASLSQSASSLVKGISSSLSYLSDSASKSSKSSSKEEKKKESEARFFQDAKDITIPHLTASKSEFSTEDFQTDLQRASESHGIQNWNANLGTYQAIGMGIRKAGLTDTEFETILTTMTTKIPSIQTSLRTGYYGSKNK